MKYLLPFITLGVLAVAACSGSTTDVADGGTSSGDGGAGGDGSSSSSDGGGGGGTPQEVQATFSNCQDFTPCGDDPTGTWFYTGACVDLLTSVKQACPTATISKSSGTVKGKLVFDGKKVTRDATASASATVNLPQACTQGADCATVQSIMAQSGINGTCTAAGTGCDCALTETFTQNSSDAYTLDGNGTLTLANGDKYAICAKGTTLHHKQTAAAQGGQVEPGIFDLTKQ